MHLATFHGAVSYHLASGDAGIEQTIGLIRRLVDTGIKTPIVNETAIRALNEGAAEQFSDLSAARAIYEWVRRNIRYVPDPVNKEMVSPADVILHVGAGDCDDINGVLLPSLLGRVGITTRLVTVAADPAMPEQFSHVYCEALIDGAWIPLDAARAGAQFALAPETVFRRQVWNLYDGSGPQVGQLHGPALGVDRAILNGVDWGAVITGATHGAAEIISAGRGYPTYPNQLPPGYYPPVVTGAGTVMTTSGGVATNINPLLLVAGLALMVFLVKK